MTGFTIGVGGTKAASRVIGGSEGAAWVGAGTGAGSWAASGTEGAASTAGFESVRSGSIGEPA
jgi:hypothetical protein